jgi:hypothetical protein
MSIEKDRALLKQVLGKGDILEDNRDAFEDMLLKLDEKERELSPKQRAYVKNILGDDAEDDEPRVLFSSGKIPLGKPVETPAVLKNLPLKPPGRK